MAVQDVSLDVGTNFGNSRLKPSETSFSAVFRTSITFDRKQSDVISGMAEDPNSVRFVLKVGDSRSNRS